MAISPSANSACVTIDCTSVPRIACGICRAARWRVSPESTGAVRVAAGDAPSAWCGRGRRRRSPLCWWRRLLFLLLRQPTFLLLRLLFPIGIYLNGRLLFGHFDSVFRRPILLQLDHESNSESPIAGLPTFAPIELDRRRVVPKIEQPDRGVEQPGSSSGS